MQIDQFFLHGPLHRRRISNAVPPFFQIPAEASYLYDAVYLYGKALSDVLESGGNPLNGTAIIEAMKGIHYESAMG